MNPCIVFIAVVLFVGCCNAGVVRRHFNLDNELLVTESENGSSENSPQASKIENSPQANKIEIFNSTLSIAEQSNSSRILNFTAETKVSSEMKSNDRPQILTDVHDNTTQELNFMSDTSEKPDEFNIFDNELKSTESIINGSELISDDGLFRNSEVNQKTLNDIESSDEKPSNEFHVPMNISLDNLKNEENVSRPALDIDVNSEQNGTNPLNEIFVYHKDLLNSTDTDAFNQSASFLSKSNGSLIAFQKQIENFTKESKPSSETSGSEGITKRGSIAETNGIFSGIGLDFIINSEVARNAAKAMEIFNFTDSLTDHIIEENEFHSFLATELPVSFDELNSSISPITLKVGTFPIGSVEISEEIEKPMIGSSTNASEKSEDKNLVNLTVSKAQEISGNSTLNLTDLRIERNETREQFDGIKNKTIKLEEWNRTLNLSTLGNTSKVVETATISEANLNNSVSNSDVDDNNSSKCPPPGFCILWLWSQDTCAVNSHCLGSRICCRVGCARTCIEV